MMIYRYIKNSIIVFCSVVTIFLLSGCASLSESECISANWFDQGFDDVQRGKSSNHVAKHTDACADYAITPDFAQYKLGWQQGLSKFCTAQSGWRYGEAGHYYRNICSANTEQQFLSGYRLGRKIKDKKAEISELRSDSRQLYSSAFSEGLTNQQKFDLSTDRFSLRLDIQSLQLDIIRLENQARALGFF